MRNITGNSVFVALSLLVAMAPVKASAQLVTGSFTGDGTDDRIIDGLGFQPDFILIKAETVGLTFTAHSDGPTASSEEQVKRLNTSVVAYASDYIQQFNAYGFEVGTQDGANKNSDTIYFIAFKANDSTIYTGKYTGNGTADTDISCCGSDTPTGVWVFTQMLADAAAVSFDTSPTMTGTSWGTNSLDTANSFDGSSSGNFRVDTDNLVNNNTKTYPYVAFVDDASTMTSGTFTGDGNTGRNITTTGVDPAAVFVKCDGTVMAMRFASLGAGNVSMRVNTTSISITNHISALGTGQFTIEDGQAVNHLNDKCVYFAFEDNPPALAVKFRYAKAKSYAGEGVLLEWATGFESENLGFRIYRLAEDGERTKISTSLIAGSALFMRSHIKMQAGRVYRYWDRSANAIAGESYVVEAIDSAGSKDYSEVVRATKSSRSSGSGIVNPSPSVGAVARQMSSTTMLAPVEIQLSKSTPRVDLSGQSRPTQPMRVATQNRLGRPITMTSSTLKANSPAICDGQANSADVLKQWSVAKADAIKIAVQKAGWYRVTAKSLFDAGFSAGVKTENLQLFADGQEVSVEINDGGKGRLDIGDTVEFYGLPLDTAASGERIYWLVEGAGPGMRIAPVTYFHAAPSNETSVAPSRATYNERKIYLARLLNGEEGQSFFGALITNDGLTNQNIDLHRADLTSSVPVTIDVVLQGIPSEVDHNVAMTVNGEVVGQLLFSADDNVAASFSFPHSFLKEGPNSVGFQALGQSVDLSVIDYFHINYQRRLVLESDAIHFGWAGKEPMTIDSQGLPVRIVEIGDNADVASSNISPSNSHVSIQLSDEHQGAMLALTADGALAPAWIKRDVGSTLHDESNAAELLIVSHPEFLPAAERLATARRLQGWTVRVVDVQDVYDEFGFGSKSVEGMRCAFSWAKRRWAQGPSHIILFGDASFDRRDFLGFGDRDRVPTMLIDSQYQKTASDDWFVDFDRDKRADLSIGRLPARTAEEAEALVNKLLAYDKVGDAQWKKRALILTDKGLAASHERLLKMIPESWQSESVLYDPASVESGRTTLLELLDKGVGLINFMGHGSVGIWAQGESLLDEKQAYKLANGERLPFVIAASCLNGFFQDLYVDSIAEQLTLAPNGGAIGTFAFSGMGMPWEHGLLSEKLIERLSTDRDVTLGDAIRESKNKWGTAYRLNWIFLGDPSMRLKLAGTEPPSPDLTISPSPGDDGPAPDFQVASTIDVGNVPHGGCAIVVDEYEREIPWSLFGLAIFCIWWRQSRARFRIPAGWY